MTRNNSLASLRSGLNCTLAQAAGVFELAFEHRTNPRPTIQHFVRDIFPRGRPVSYLQIGARDGAQNDPIATFRHEPGWSGVLVEPNPHVFSRLRANLANLRNARPINCAVVDRVGPIAFYVAADPTKTDKPAWADQVSSLDREHVRRFLGKWTPAGTDIKPTIATIRVPACTIDALLATTGCAHLDLLLLDVEGLTFQLLKTFPFARFQPELIIFETVHLTSDEITGIPQFLDDRGYDFWPMGEDFVAPRWALAKGRTRLPFATPCPEKVN